MADELSDEPPVAGLIVTVNDTGRTERADRRGQQAVRSASKCACRTLRRSRRATGNLRASRAWRCVTYRGRTHLTQEQLATRIGVHSHTIQGWESGAYYPSTDSLRALTAAYLAAGAFVEGQAEAEAAALWTAALRQAPRLRPEWDQAWFASIDGDELAGFGRGAAGRKILWPRPGAADAPALFAGRSLSAVRRWAPSVVASPNWSVTGPVALTVTCTLPSAAAEV